MTTGGNYPFATAWVYERHGEGGRATARFDTHAEGRDPRLHERGPSDVDIDTALAWAQARAPSVRVMLAFGAYFSAGDEPNLELGPPWPPPAFVLRPRPEATRWIATYRTAGSAADVEITLDAETSLQAALAFERLRAHLGAVGDVGFHAHPDFLTDPLPDAS